MQPAQQQSLPLTGLGRPWSGWDGTAHGALHGGLNVLDLSPDGVARKAGIQRGDILIGLHQWETLSLDNVNYVLTHPDLGSLSPLRFFIIRAGQVQRGWLPQID